MYQSGTTKNNVLARLFKMHAVITLCKDNHTCQTLTVNLFFKHFNFKFKQKIFRYRFSTNSKQLKDVANNFFPETKFSKDHLMCKYF